jgi:hypothetical protein
LQGEGGRRPDEGSAENLDRWQCELDRCYDGKPSHPITIALADSLLRFAIPKSAFVALIDGCRQDLVKNRYDNFDELLDYCRMVALSIADISLAIFGYKAPRAIEYGRSLATALQLTNVTRDIGDDLARGRVYVPQDELCRFGVTRIAASPEMRQLIEFARDAEDEMPRVFGMNHHPEIIDREHVLEVLNEKRSHGEVSERWYRERADTMTDLLQGENERQSRLTSEFTFIGPLRHHIAQLIEERCGVRPSSAGLAG